MGHRAGKRDGGGNHGKRVERVDGPVCGTARIWKQVQWNSSTVGYVNRTEYGSEVEHCGLDEDTGCDQRDRLGDSGGHCVDVR